MMEGLNDQFGLAKSVKLQLLESNHIAIVKIIKSRIIQKDAQKILEIVNIIRNHNSSIKVSLLCNPNICSKSIALLKESGVEVVVV